MNRMEMFMELKKDPSKRFRSIAKDVTVEYLVKDGIAYCRYKDRPGMHKITHLIFSDDAEYAEIIRPLWEVIEEKNSYWYVDFSEYDQVCCEIYCRTANFDISNKKHHNMFRTEEEALAKAEELLKVLKN